MREVEAEREHPEEGDHGDFLAKLIGHRQKEDRGAGGKRDQEDGPRFKRWSIGCANRLRAGRVTDARFRGLSDAHRAVRDPRGERRIRRSTARPVSQAARAPRRRTDN